MTHFEKNPNSWLYSESFLKRCFAIWGHFMIAHLILALIFWTIIAIAAVAYFSTFGTFDNQFKAEQKIIEDTPL